MECAENYCGTVGNVQKNESIHRASPVHIQQEYIGLDCTQLNSTQRASMDAGVKTPQCPHLSRHYFISIL